jgi:hypothetical protein
VSLVARLTPIIDVGGLRLGVADELQPTGIFPSPCFAKNLSTREKRALEFSTASRFRMAGTIGSTPRLSKIGLPRGIGGSYCENARRQPNRSGG